MKSSVTNIFIFSILLLLSFSSCSKKSSRENGIKAESAIFIKTDTVNHANIDSIFLLKKDSLYNDLISKVKNNYIYVPVIQCVMDSLTVTNTHFGDTLFYDYFTSNYFFDRPLKYLKKIKINDYTLVIADFSYENTLDYFIVNQNNKVTDHVSFSSYREIVSSRKIDDWNKDGKDELVEIRENHGQMWETSTDAVYSIVNDSLKLIFACTTREINCMTTGPHGEGGFVIRKYRYKGNGIYLISETEGYNNCNKDYFVPIKTLKWNEYKMSIDELLKEFGEKYNR